MFVETIAKEDLEAMEIAAFKGRIQVIDSEGEDFDKAVRYLSSRKVLGFDTETRPCFSSSQPPSPCLCDLFSSWQFHRDHNT